MNERLELTDDLLVRALRQRTDVALPPGLLSRVMAGATGMSQQGAPRRWLRLRSSGGTPGIPIPALAGAAIAVVLLVAAIALRPALNGPGSWPTPTPIAPTGGPSVEPSAPPATPEPRVLGAAAALRLRLGIDVAPIDVFGAFNSIWTADIHANDVRRFDPATMRELARIPVAGGPAWFVVADDALWVSTQNGRGLTRIDPATNTVVATVGEDPPCAAPILVAGFIWQAACDADVILRIDPVRNVVAERIPAQGHGFLASARGAFVALSPSGYARFDPVARTFTKLAAYAGPTGALAMSDGDTLWVLGGSQVLRIDPVDGHTLASFPYPGAVAATFDGGRAIITSGTDGVIEIDRTTNKVVRTTPVPAPWVARSVEGVLWVTDFTNSSLWRVEP